MNIAAFDKTVYFPLAHTGDDRRNLWRRHFNHRLAYRTKAFKSLAPAAVRDGLVKGLDLFKSDEA